MTLRVLTFGLLLFTMMSCNNDIELTGPWKDIPITYAYLSIDDTAHYVRLEKAFLDPSVSAIEISQIADSIYYPNAEVTLRNKTTGASILMQRVDGNLEGYPKDPGTFTTSPNYLYKVKSSDFALTPRDEYEVSILREEQSELVTGSTFVLDRGIFTSPDPSDSQPTISFDGISPKYISWSADKNARVFQVYAIMHILEASPTDPNNFYDVDLKWPLEDDLVIEKPNTSGDFYYPSIQVDPSRFFTFLRGQLDNTPGYRRKFLNMDMVVTSAGEEIATYLEILKANDGITGNEPPIEYSNMSEGLGLISSRASIRLDGIFLAGSATQDSLQNGIVTGGLGFE